MGESLGWDTCQGASLPLSMAVRPHPGRFQPGSAGWEPRAEKELPSESHYKAVQPCTKRLKSHLKKRAWFFLF